MEEIINLIEKTKNGTGDSDKHLMSLFSIVLGSNSKNIIELGVRNGDSTLPLTLGAYHNNGHVFSIDINESNYELPKFLKKNQTFIKSDAIKYLESWDENKNIDLVYLDDWHSYDHVKKELDILFLKRINNK
jgi:predicted O-methyltransferase YrrM